MKLTFESGQRDDSLVFMSTDTGKRVITEDLVLNYLHCMANSKLDEVKATLRAFEYAVLHSWTINLDTGPYTGKFVDCAKQAQRYELRMFLAVLICWKREKLPEETATDGLVPIMQKLSMNTPTFMVALSYSLDALELTKSKAQLQTDITAAEKTKFNEIHQAPKMVF